MKSSKQRPRTDSVPMFITENLENPEKHQKVNIKTHNPPHRLYSYLAIFKNWHHIIANFYFHSFHIMSWELTPPLKCRRWKRKLDSLLQHSERDKH